MNKRYVLYSVLSGVLLSLPWYGFSGFFLLVAFVPLFSIVYSETKEPVSRHVVPIWFYPFISTLIWNSISTWWIWNASPIGAVSAILINTLLMTMTWALFIKVKTLKGVGYGNFFFVFVWLSFEFLHYHWELSWPWLTLGNGFANNVWFIQWYEYTGVFGGSLLILFSNLFVHLFLIRNGQKKVYGIILLILIVFPMMVSFWLFRKVKEDSHNLQVAVIQPNIDPFHEKFNGIPLVEQYSIIIKLADSVCDMNCDFIIAPETALQSINESHPDKDSTIAMFRKVLEEKNTAWIIGAETFRRNETDVDYFNDNKLSSASTITENYNAAIYLGKNDETKVYHKSKLVPGVEFMPFSRYIQIFNRFLINIGSSNGSFIAGKEATVFDTRKGKIAVAVCFESAYGEYLAQMARMGGRALFIITNDGWWLNTPGYKQHLALARIRAIENRWSVVRAANTGVSAIINYNGEIVIKTNFGETTAFQASIPYSERETYYAQNGDYIARFATFMFILMSLGAVVEAIKKRNRIMPH